MNYYVVVEGAVEKKVYSKWIPLINPSLKQIHEQNQMTEDTFIIYNGGGYPSILEMIEDAIADIVSSGRECRLVVAIDSEEMTRQDKLNEMNNYINDKSIGINLDYKIIVQHYCFETWALGNRKIVADNPNNPELVEYLMHYHVRKNDPELLTKIPSYNGNRAQFAETYLRKLLQQKFRQTYTKGSPEVVTHPNYLNELKNRLKDTTHIDSFGELLATFT